MLVYKIAGLDKDPELATQQLNDFIYAGWKLNGWHDGQVLLVKDKEEDAGK